MGLVGLLVFRCFSWVAGRVGVLFGCFFVGPAMFLSEPDNPINR